MLKYAMLLEMYPDREIILDFSWWNYFDRKNQRVVNYDYDKFINAFRLHPRVILAPDAISKINKRDIGELPIDFPKAEAGFVQRKGHFGPEGIYLDYENLMILPREDLGMEHKGFSTQSHPRLNYVGVHARLGNGEKMKNGKAYSRMDIPPRLFIEAMRKFNHNFYVCSDTKSFIDLCRDKFGDRVRAQSREHINHLRRMRDAEADPVSLIKEALMDILILSKCRYLICNPSSFTELAKNIIPDRNIIRVDRKRVDYI